jgi:hypothetical protein
MSSTNLGGGVVFYIKYNKEVGRMGIRHVFFRQPIKFSYLGTKKSTEVTSKTLYLDSWASSIVINGERKLTFVVYITHGTCVHVRHMNRAHARCSLYIR